MGGRKLTLRASLVLAQRPTVVLIEVLVCSSISTLGSSIMHTNTS